MISWQLKAANQLTLAYLYV